MLALNHTSMFIRNLSANSYCNANLSAIVNFIIYKLMTPYSLLLGVREIAQGVNHSATCNLIRRCLTVSLRLSTCALDKPPSFRAMTIVGGRKKLRINILYSCSCGNIIF
ncbi:unnamed protein product [Moneuplotes crassus]|uniref:Uncharacterized protein n=1 Tax=Euplotes crassus TaxID=5936 RepID=A0AAD1U4D5_EUPCR|nr:unnamed protein product [Moneuplotes crassus]